jgi:hypothetical protein
MNRKNLPMANTVPTSMNEERVSKEIIRSNLCGLANNTKWNELITYMRDKKGWLPSWRSKSLSGFVSDWDVEWHYHLPFPFKLVLWFDIGCHEKEFIGGLDKYKVINHTKELEKLLVQIGFEFEINHDFVRIFGYAPKDYDKFDINHKESKFKKATTQGLLEIKEGTEQSFDVAKEKLSFKI